MDEHLDKQLVKDCPNLYRDRNEDMRITAMCWGFPETGWHDLIRKASVAIEAEIMKMPKEDRPNYRATQVKEKFGTLRFYMSATTPEMDKAIDEAEYASAHTCETWGKEGKLMNNRGWVSCVCQEHGKDSPPLPTRETLNEEKA